MMFCSPIPPSRGSWLILPLRTQEARADALELVPAVMTERGCYVGRAKGRNRPWRNARALQPNVGCAAEGASSNRAATVQSRPRCCHWASVARVARTTGLGRST